MCDKLVIALEREILQTATVHGIPLISSSTAQTETENVSSEWNTNNASNSAQVNNSVRFVNEWLCSITDAVLGLVLQQMLKIKRLSRSGCMQLFTDLEYLR